MALTEAQTHKIASELPANPTAANFLDLYGKYGPDDAAEIIAAYHNNAKTLIAARDKLKRLLVRSLYRSELEALNVQAKEPGNDFFAVVVHEAYRTYEDDEEEDDD